MLSISSNTALFSLLGTTFGGDGKTATAVPEPSTFGYVALIGLAIFAQRIVRARKNAR